MKRTHMLWALLLLPLGALTVPVLFFVMVTGTRVLSIFVGPINVWNTPSSNPSANDIAGDYRLSNRSVAQIGAGGEYFYRDSTIKLKPDHTVELVDVRSYEGSGDAVECVFNTRGTWKTNTTGFESQLELNLQASLPVAGVRPCGPMYFAVMNLLGRHQPYRIWYVVGDPDSDIGLSYERR